MIFENLKAIKELKNGLKKREILILKNTSVNRNNWKSGGLKHVGNQSTQYNCPNLHHKPHIAFEDVLITGPE